MLVLSIDLAVQNSDLNWIGRMNYILPVFSCAELERLWRHVELNQCGHILYLEGGVFDLKKKIGRLQEKQGPFCQMAAALILSLVGYLPDE